MPVVFKVCISLRVDVRVRHFLFSAPAFSSAWPWNVGRTARGTVTITGLNFGACFTPTASLGDSLNRPCASTSWISTTSIECGVQAWRGGVLEEVVTVGAIVGTRLGAFTLPTGHETRRASFSFDGATPRSPSAGFESITPRRQRLWSPNFYRILRVPTPSGRASPCRGLTL